MFSLCATAAAAMQQPAGELLWAPLIRVVQFAHAGLLAQGLTLRWWRADAHGLAEDRERLRRLLAG